MFWRKWFKKVDPSQPAVPMKKSKDREEEPSGLHEISILTVQNMRSPINDLILQLQEAKEQAQNLVDTLDVPKMKTTPNSPATDAEEDIE